MSDPLPRGSRQDFYTIIIGTWLLVTLYGERWYPDDSLPLITTQTIQLTCYLSSALFSCVLFLILIRKRIRPAEKA